jgi:hypothetical protein
MTYALIDDFTLHGEQEPLSLWRGRSWRFRLRHRWNVLALWLLGDISPQSAARALRWPHCYTALAFKTPGRGMVWICPAVLAELDRIDDGGSPSQPSDAVAGE